jgi:hypothetical protein
VGLSLNGVLRRIYASKSERMSMDEATKAAKALLFFCDDMDPKRQWEKAVELLLPMNHMEKARVWNAMTASENISDIILSRRRTAYKRALKAVEEERGGGVDQVSPPSNVSLDHNLLRIIDRLKKKIEICQMS